MHTFLHKYTFWMCMHVGVQSVCINVDMYWVRCWFNFFLCCFSMKAWFSVSFFFFFSSFLFCFAILVLLLLLLLLCNHFIHVKLKRCATIFSIEFRTFDWVLYHSTTYITPSSLSTSSLSSSSSSLSLSSSSSSS